MNKIINFDFDNVWIKTFDWSTAIVCLFYGIIVSDYLWAVAGGIGVVASWYRPIGRFQRFMNSIVHKRNL